MRRLFIAWEYGIAGGKRLGVINKVDVAPSIAALPGLKMEGVTGEQLDAVLKLPAAAKR